jgi:hypothetical protein
MFSVQAVKRMLNYVGCNRPPTLPLTIQISSFVKFVIIIVCCYESVRVDVAN